MVMGTKGKRFYKVVAANQRDPRDGKHMEVLGTYVPIPASSPATSELRLRFSRVKFWLAVGASFPTSVGRLLGSAGLIPSPPPLYGWRCRGRYHELLQQQQQQQQMLREAELREFFKLPSPVSTRRLEGEDGATRKKETPNCRVFTDFNSKASCCGGGQLRLINEVADIAEANAAADARAAAALFQQQLLTKGLKCRRPAALHCCSRDSVGCSTGFNFEA
ncbi:hypothetical protein Esti_000752 [Eimeria stiedai]